MEFVMSSCCIHFANTMDTTVVLIPRVSNNARNHFEIEIENDFQARALAARASTL